MSYRKNSVIDYWLEKVEQQFQKGTGVEPDVDSVPYANFDFAYDFSDRGKPKLMLYSGLGSFATAGHPDPRVVQIFDQYLPEVIKIYKEGKSK